MHHFGEEHEHGHEHNMSKCCDNCESCTYCGGGHHGKKGKIYMLLGVLAIVYGIINYLIAVAGMPDYNAWIFGGVLLVIIGLLKSGMSKYH